MSSSLNVVLIVGSAPDALMIKDQDLSLFSSCVVINNAWQLNKDWDYLIYPEDFPDKHLPPDTVLAKKKNNYGPRICSRTKFFWRICLRWWHHGFHSWLLGFRLFKTGCYRVLRLRHDLSIRKRKTKSFLWKW